jgi:2-C-methyl-D-erythritol 4-phosphate cytidylyltransferase
VTWVVVPAAGRGTRFGSELPKQYLEVAGRPLIAYTLNALLSHPSVSGAVVVLAEDDRHWHGWESLAGKPVAVPPPTSRCLSRLASRWKT